MARMAKDVIHNLGDSAKLLKQRFLPKQSSDNDSCDKAGFMRFDMNGSSGEPIRGSQSVDDGGANIPLTEMHPASEKDLHFGYDNNEEYGECGVPGNSGTEEHFGKDSKDQITEWQAAWNVTNAIQGMFIVSFPYAVRHGGYWAIIAMTGIAYICCHTGKILVDCLYETSDTGEKIRVRSSYVEVAEAVWGRRFGSRVVNIAQIIELLMTCILYLVLCGDLMIGSFPDTALGLRGWISLASVTMLPCALLTTLRHVSWISFWNTVTHVIINAVVIIYCVTRSADWKPNTVQFKIDIWTFPISLGIIVFSYTSQIFLPSLEGNLIDRSKFRPMLYSTHIAAAIFKALFGYLGFLTFGDDTEEVITNNLTSYNLKVMVNLALVVKSLLSYPLPYYASVKLIEASLYQGKSKTRFESCLRLDGSIKVWGIFLRSMLVVFTLFMALSIPHFAILMGLIGSVTGTMLSFVWPAYFHLRLKSRSIGWLTWLFDICIIIIGFFCGIIGFYYSAHALQRVMHGDPIRPTLPVLNKPDNSTSLFRNMLQAH